MSISHRRRSRGAALLACAALLASPVLVPIPAQAADDTASSQDLVLQNGTDDTQRLLSWQADAETAQTVRWAKSSAVGDSDIAAGTLPDSANLADATSATAIDDRYAFKAAMTGLAANTEYVYQVGSDDAGWSDVYTFTNKVTDEFNVFGDPQIGSTAVDSDGEGWERTLDASLTANPNAAFFLGLGDQIEHASNQNEYAAYLSPEKTRTFPQATTLGNHEVGSTAYGEHFSRPNVSTEYNTNVTGTGGDYWFISNDVLFVNFNANASSADDIAGHKEFLDKVVAAHGDNARWTAVVFHKAPYSTASHMKDADVARFRAAFPEALSDNNVDIVLGGHDHIYSRTHLLDGDGKPGNADEDVVTGETLSEKTADASTPVDLTKADGESLYYTLTSSSGSKYYSMSTDTAMAAVGFPVDNIDVTEQNETPGYLNVKVSCGALTLTTHEVSTSGDDSVLETVNLKKADASDCATDDPTDEATDDPADSSTDRTTDGAADATDDAATDSATAGATDVATQSSEGSTDEAGSGGSLPRTGTMVGLITLGGLLLLAIGALSALPTRRKRKR